MSRAGAEKAYRELRLPTSSDEGWRFTDLTGFDPGAYELAATARPAEIAPLFELELAGSARIDESGVEILAAPDGVVFAPPGQKDKRIGTLVAVKDKIGADNAAHWRHGLLVEVPAGVELAAPLHVRIESTVAGAALPTRLFVVAGENSRFTLIEEHVSAAEGLDAFTNCAVEVEVGAGAKLELVTAQLVKASRPGTSPISAPAWGATRSSTGSASGSARARGRPGSSTTSPKRGRPRASPASTSPTARSTSTTTPTRSTRRRTRTPTSSSAARCATRRRRSGAA